MVLVIIGFNRIYGDYRMGSAKKFIILFMIFLGSSAISKEIVVGIERRPIKKIAIMLTPVVIPDLLSLKTALEYSPYKKISIIWPIEAKWMDYRWAIKTGTKFFNGPKDIPEKYYQPQGQFRPLWNIDFSQIKVLSGLGIKYFPFSQANKNAFFIKTNFLAGLERFNAYSAEGVKDSAVFAHVLSFGYTWVWDGGFMLGAEIGEEYIWHTNPIKGLPDIFFQGLNPIIHLNMGLTF